MEAEEFGKEFEQYDTIDEEARGGSVGRRGGHHARNGGGR